MDKPPRLPPRPPGMDVVDLTERWWGRPEETDARILTITRMELMDAGWTVAICDNLLLWLNQQKIRKKGAEAIPTRIRYVERCLKLLRNN